MEPRPTEPSSPLRRRTLLTASLGAGLAGVAGLELGAAPARADQTTTGHLGPFWTMNNVRLRGLPKASTRTPVSPSYMGSLVMDARGIPLSLVNGQRVAHPTQIGNWMLAHTSSWEVDHQRNHLTLVGRALDAEMKIADRHGDGSSVRYEFAWPSAGMPRNWHSSFGQTKYLLAAHRLYRATGDRKYLGHQQRLRAAFLYAQKSGTPFVSFVDPGKHYWFEEYPNHRTGTGMHVFNGNVYAMLAALEFALATRDLGMERLVRGALYTMFARRDTCRVPGNVSLYDATRMRPLASYHTDNTLCYKYCFDVTGHTGFGRVVDALVKDYPFTQGTGQVRLLAGSLATVRYRGRSLTWRVGRETLLTSSSRRNFGKGGAWSQMAEGPYAGGHVAETASAFRTGYGTDRLEFAQPRAVVLAAGATATGYGFTSNGTRRAVRTRHWPASSLAHSDARAKIGGRHYMHVTDGYYQGLWVEETSSIHYS